MKDLFKIMKDIENNEAIETDNVNENAKKQFLKGAEVAYEQIITYFAKGDKKSLKPLLGKSLFDDFSEVKTIFTDKTPLILAIFVLRIFTNSS